MEAKFMGKWLIMIFFLVIQMQICNGCLEKERLGLLNIKAFFSSFTKSYDPLPSWIGADCCNWKGVICNLTTSGHVVVELTFQGILDYDHFLLNVSLFQPFKELRSLDLSYNRFSSFIENKVFSRLKRLEILNLNYNKFNNSIFSSLSGLTSLQTLILSNNILEGSVPTHDISKLKSLQVLDLSSNLYYEGAIPLQDLKNLRGLDLSWNEFNDSSLPLHGLCESNNLIELDISFNDIRGPLSQCLMNFTKLRYLDITWNQFSGEIPSAISNLTSIMYLSMGGNYFEGSFSFSYLANLTQLKVFKLFQRQGSKLQVETEKPHWLPTFQLQSLTLHNCNLNRKTGSKIPTFLSLQRDLVVVDLARNQLIGTFPHWLLRNNSYLWSLNLNNNSLTGTLELPTQSHGLKDLQISDNNFSGLLPDNIGSLLPDVYYFNISRNSFEGTLPFSMEHMKALQMVDLSHNKFSGNLRLSMFTGLYFPACLLVANNNFSGSIEDAHMNTTGLMAFDISKNTISGKIPRWIGSLKRLQYLQISGNHFEGEIPVEICSLHRLTFLDVSQNQLFGQIPSCFYSSDLLYLNMRENHFSGPIPYALSNGSELLVLDLSYNKFSGHIPNWFSRFISLRVLLLKRNELQGPIPQQLCQVREIGILDLSSNKLNGSIPSCLNDISFGVLKGQDYSNIPKGSAGFYEHGVMFQYATLLSGIRFIYDPDETYSLTLEDHIGVDFTTKSSSYTYSGDILNYMSGLDLSDNDLTGHIPPQIGDLRQVRALNFSRNKLEGFIPKTVSNLKQLESLDLSYNLLRGNIPSQLGELNSLAVFNVSYNNLSGMIPTSPHFQTYSGNSYLGNSYLCGAVIEKKCPSPTLPPNNQSAKGGGEDHETIIDLEAFYWSFGITYVIILLGFAIVLYINPHWREAWFYFVHVRCPYVCKYI